MTEDRRAAATVGAELRQAGALGLTRLDAQLLLGHVLAHTRSWLLAHDDAPLDRDGCAAWRTLRDRRLAGEPVAYLVGTKEFHGLTLHVDARALVPRPETEHLVDWALELLGAAGAPRRRVVDLGTGSGAVALAVKSARPDAQVVATDADDGALAVARANGSRLGIDIDWRSGDWWQPLRAERVDLALSNPPYIAGTDPHLADLRHEPQHALTPGGDGLGALRAIVAGAPAHLRPGGWLLLEHGHDQADAVQSMLRRQGFTAVDTRRDLAGLPRCTGGRLDGVVPA